MATAVLPHLSDQDEEFLLYYNKKDKIRNFKFDLIRLNIQEDVSLGMEEPPIEELKRLSLATTRTVDDELKLIKAETEDFTNLLSSIKFYMIYLLNANANPNYKELMNVYKQYLILYNSISGDVINTNAEAVFYSHFYDKLERIYEKKFVYVAGKVANINQKMLENMLKYNKWNNLTSEVFNGNYLLYFKRKILGLDNNDKRRYPFFRIDLDFHWKKMLIMKLCEKQIDELFDKNRILRKLIDIERDITLDLSNINLSDKDDSVFKELFSMQTKYIDLEDFINRYISECINSLIYFQNNCKTLYINPNIFEDPKEFLLSLIKYKPFDPSKTKESIQLQYYNIIIQFRTYWNNMLKTATGINNQTVVYEKIAIEIPKEEYKLFITVPFVKFVHDSYDSILGYKISLNSPSDKKFIIRTSQNTTDYRYLQSQSRFIIIDPKAENQQIPSNLKKIKLSDYFGKRRVNNFDLLNAIWLDLMMGYYSTENELKVLMLFFPVNEVSEMNRLMYFDFYNKMISKK